MARIPPRKDGSGLRLDATYNPVTANNSVVQKTLFVKWSRSPSKLLTEGVDWLECNILTR
jgi:hypothetical protein